MSIQPFFEVTYIDPYCQYIPGVDRECYTFNLSYDELAGTHGKYNTLERGTDITITYPLANANELDRLSHISTQAASDNRDKYITKIGGLDQLNVEKQIDNIIIKLSDLAFESENRKITNFSADPRHVYSLLICYIRGMSSFGDLTEHLLQNPEIAEEIGYDKPDKKRNYYRIENELEERSQRKIISNAAKRIVHSLWRNGYPLPGKITNSWELEAEMPITVSSREPSVKRAALVNWMAYLLPRLKDDITFDRGDNTKYSILEIIGSLAQAALIQGCYSAKPAAGWHYNDNELMGGRRLSDLISDVDTEKTINIFNQINNKFINIATDLGFFDSGYNYAADTTWINYYGDDMPETINNPKRCTTGEGLCFASASIMENNARFAAGIDIVKSKENYANIFSSILVDIAHEHPIKGIYMDREMVSDDNVQTCRLYSDNWVIRCKKLPKGEIEEKYNSLEKGDSFGPEKVSFSGVKPDPQLYIHPIGDEDEYPGETSGSHMLFLVGDGFDEDDGQDIHDNYRSRWSVETFFRQLKHNFAPQTKTNDIEERLFLLNIGMLFYNIHTLINRAPSPRYGLPLDAPHYMVLKGIVEYVFNREAAYNE